jgi:hypothetical protein
MAANVIILRDLKSLFLDDRGYILFIAKRTSNPVAVINV